MLASQKQVKSKLHVTRAPTWSARGNKVTPAQTIRGPSYASIACFNVQDEAHAELDENLNRRDVHVSDASAVETAPRDVSRGRGGDPEWKQRGTQVGSYCKHQVAVDRAT